MIKRWYEITCDYCGAAINHFPYKPTNDELEADGCVCTKTKHFCNDVCFGYWNHDRQEKQYLNLHPDGRIHHDTPKSNVLKLGVPLKLNTPREECKVCYNWNTQEDVGERNFPCCQDSNKPECYNYLMGKINHCPNQLIQ